MMAAGHKKQGAAFAAPFLGTLLLCWQGLGQAAAIDVNPVRLDLAGAGQSRELRIRNEDLKAVSVEVTAWAWSQDADGGDRLDPTEDILAVPPIFTIEPGEQQIVRVAFLGDLAPGRELSYRLLATELAPPAGPQGPAVSMRLQISLPVFVTAPGDSPKADIRLLSTRQTSQGTEVTLSNAGTAHTKLRSVQVAGGDGTTPAPDQTPVGQAHYLLPGTTARFLVPGDPGTPLRVRISPEGGEGWEHAVASSE